MLTTVAQACRDTERLEFSYVAASGKETDRRVEPHRLVSLGHRWYLAAFELSRGAWRSFRLDRLHGLRSTGIRFRPRQLPAADAAAFVRAGIDHLPLPYDVEALVDAPAGEVRDRFGRWAEVEDVDPGRCRLRMSTDSLDWPAMALGSVGAEFTVVSPPELLVHLRDWAERFGRAAAPGNG